MFVTSRRSTKGGGRPPLWTPLVEESQPSGLSGPHAHAPCRLKVSLSSKLRCRAPQLPPAVLFGQKIGQGRKLVKKVKIWKVLRMGLPIVEILSGLQESIFSLFRGPQLNSRKKNMVEFYLIIPIPPISPRWANGCLGSLGLLLFIIRLEVV